MKRTIIQSLIFSGVFIILYYGVQIAMGYYMALKFAPEITESYQSYQSVEYLQNEVVFGYIYRPYGVIGEIIGLWIIGMILFFSGRFVMKKRSGINKTCVRPIDGKS